MFCQKILQPKPPLTFLSKPLRPKFYSSVLQHEVEKFSKLSHDWWNPDGELHTLHQINPLRMRYIRQHLCSHFSLNPNKAKPLSGLRIVDVGCGGGLLSESLARLGGSVTGIDASESNIKVAKLHSHKDPIFENILAYYHTTAEDLCKEAQGKFDVVCALEIIEHVADARAFVKPICDLVKPGGAIFLSTINKTFKSYIHTIVIAENVLQWIPKGTHDWSQYISPKDLQAMLAQNNVQWQDTKGFGFRPFSADGKRWALESDQDVVNYLLFATKENRGNE